jgi:hypothetical protein
MLSQRGAGSLRTLVVLDCGHHTTEQERNMAELSDLSPEARAELEDQIRAELKAELEDRLRKEIRNEIEIEYRLSQEA